MHMYLKGNATRAIMSLLLNATAETNRAYFGDAVVPQWITSEPPEKRVKTLKFLLDLAKACRGKRRLTQGELSGLGVTYLPLGGEIQQHLKRYQTSESNPTWSEVGFRLTLGWDDESVLVLENFEVGGDVMPGARRAIIGENCRYGCTLWLGGPAGEQPRGGAVPADDWDIDGSEVVGETSITEIHEIARRTGLTHEELKSAYAQIDTYRLRGTQLQRSLFSKQSGTYEWYTVVPSTGWRTVEHGRTTHEMQLRRHVVLQFHSTAFSGHRGRDATAESILEAGLWWSALWDDVSFVCKHCIECKKVRGKPYVTGHVRSREYDGPFRYLIIDFVGPQRPATPRGNEYLFTCTCAFSGWYWAVPTRTDDGTTAAQCLAERVIFDIAGIPVYLGSDRAQAFIHGVVKELAEKFGLQQVIGSSFHPEAQGAVESPHKVYRDLCRSFCGEFAQNWDIVAPIFQWTVRTTLKAYNGDYTPYEIIAGLKPRFVTDSLLGSPTAVRSVGQNQYVKDLIEYLKRVHKYVAEKHTTVRDQYAKLKGRHCAVDEPLQVGDFVLYRKGHLDDSISDKNQRKWRDTIFQIIHAPTKDGARVYTLADAATGQTDNLGFAQPVTADRVIPVEVLPVTRSLEDGRTRIQLGDRQGEISGQCLDGRVYVKFADNAEERIVDLSREVYQWLN